MGAEGRTWYVVIPFATEASARRAHRLVEKETGYLAHVKSAVEDDPPEYDPGADADRIAEEFEGAAVDLARDEASGTLTPEELDRAAEQWFEQHYQPGVSDPADGGA